MSIEKVTNIEKMMHEMLPIVIMRGVNGLSVTRKALGPKLASCIKNALAFVASQNKQCEI
jgi:hypothetical protein